MKSNNKLLLNLLKTTKINLAKPKRQSTATVVNENNILQDLSFIDIVKELTPIKIPMLDTYIIENNIATLFANAMELAILNMKVTDISKNIL